MKFKHLYIAVGLFSALSLTACKKVIETEPEFNKERSELFTSLTDYEYSLAGTYAQLRQTGYFGSGAQTTSTWSNLPDMMTDNLVQTAEDLGNWTGQVNWMYAADDGDIAVAWQAAYSVIRQSNITLNNIDQFATTEPKRVNRIKGQALALRGMAHFDVLRYWGVEFDRNSTALGIPYVTTENVENKPPRLSVKESYDSIFKDMLAAEALLGNVDKAINTTTNRTSLDQVGVRGLLARMYLYAKDYVKAEEYATLAINAMPLASTTTFPQIWKDDTQAEVLFAVSFNAGEGSPSSGVHLASSNRNRFRPSTTVTSLYDIQNDIRVPSYLATRRSGNVTPPRPFMKFDTTSTDPNVTFRKVVNKFIGRGAFIDNVVNWKVVRTAEMYLIRAEARAMQGGAKELSGLADLNTLRAARISGYMPEVLTGQALLDAIQLERRKELFGEGHRWFDLKRTTRTINRTDKSLNSTRTVLGPSAREWVWPIPQSEIDANPNMKGQQTPGY